MVPIAFGRQRVWRRIGIVGAAAAIITLVLVLIGVRSPQTSGTDDGEVTLTLKGGRGLAVTRFGPGGKGAPFDPERSRLRPGDRIQLDWVSASNGCLVLFLTESGAPVVKIFPDGKGCGPVDVGRTPVGGGLMVDETTRSLCPRGQKRAPHRRRGVALGFAQGGDGAARGGGLLVFIDACNSGFLLSPKGFVSVRRQRIDAEPVGLTGRVIITSTGPTELSHESSLLRSAPFADALVSGVMGAADADGDGQVTLGELYTYIHTRVEAATPASPAGPQHAATDVRLMGTGNIVVSHIDRGQGRLGRGELSFGTCYVLDETQTRGRRRGDDCAATGARAIGRQSPAHGSLFPRKWGDVVPIPHLTLPWIEPTGVGMRIGLSFFNGNVSVGGAGGRGRRYAVGRHCPTRGQLEGAPSRCARCSCSSVRSRRR